MCLEEWQHYQQVFAITPSCPFEIVHIDVNAVVTIHLCASVTKQINICHTIPYKVSLV